MSTTNKRILILTADAGFGHRVAANAVAQALRERHGETCIVDVVNPLEDRRAPAVLRKAQDDYDRVIRAWRSSTVSAIRPAMARCPSASPSRR